MLDLHNTHAVQWLGCQYITYPLSGKTYVKTLKWLGNIFRRSSHHLSQKHVTESCDMYHATFMSCVASSLKGQIIHVWHVTKNAHVNSNVTLPTRCCSWCWDRQDWRGLFLGSSLPFAPHLFLLLLFLCDPLSRCSWVVSTMMLNEEEGDDGDAFNIMRGRVGAF